MVASAEFVEIDGIYYDLNTDGKVAEVVGLLNTNQSSVVILETVFSVFCVKNCLYF